MRAVVQRVLKAEIKVDNTVVGSIDRGLLVYLGVSADDTKNDAAYLAEKVVHLRIFLDTAGLMNLSVIDVGQDILIVSQFTLYGDTRKGRRPSYASAAQSDQAAELYNLFVALVKNTGIAVSTGRFGALMDVRYTNNGPVTLLLDSRKTF